MTITETNLAAVLADHPAVRLAILYGSVARGTAGLESDLDLAVMAPARSRPTRRSRSWRPSLARRDGPWTS